MTNYHVVFESTEAAGGYKGIRHFTSYPDQATFEREFKPSDLEIVVAKGATMDEVQARLAEVPVECYIGAALQEANVGGKPDWNIFRMEATNQLSTLMSRRGLSDAQVSRVAGYLVTKAWSIEGVEQAYTGPAMMDLVKTEIANTARFLLHINDRPSFT
jgi:hypothetical protein